MQRCNLLMLICCAGSMVFGVAISTVDAQPPSTTDHIDSKCITMLGPPTCGNGGNSFCDAYAAGGGACNGETACTYCDGTTTIPNKACAMWPGETCAALDGGVFSCGPNLHKHKWDGECRVVTEGGIQVCRCKNPVDQGECSHNYGYECIN
jgi:hypothetical protein